MAEFTTITSLQTKMIGTTFDSATTMLASACIYDAENELKKHLSARYDFADITTTAIPPILRSLTETLAIGYMYENMGRGGEDAGKRADRYIKRVMDNVSALLSGEAKLVNTAGVALTEIDGDWAVHATTEYTPTFNEDDPDSWEVDEDKLDDIESDRS